MNQGNKRQTWRCVSCGKLCDGQEIAAKVVGFADMCVCVRCVVVNRQGLLELTGEVGP